MESHKIINRYEHIGESKECYDIFRVFFILMIVCITVGAVSTSYSNHINKYNDQMSPFIIYDDDMGHHT